MTCNSCQFSGVSGPLLHLEFKQLGCHKWGCNKWGLKGCLAALPGNRPKSAFFALFLRFSLFRPFAAFFGKSRKRREKACFLRYPQICLNPHLRHPKTKSLQNKDLYDTISVRMVDRLAACSTSLPACISPNAEPNIPQSSAKRGTSTNL